MQSCSLLLFYLILFGIYIYLMGDCSALALTSQNCWLYSDEGLTRVTDASISLWRHLSRGEKGKARNCALALILIPLLTLNGRCLFAQVGSYSSWPERRGKNKWLRQRRKNQSVCSELIYITTAAVPAATGTNIHYLLCKGLCYWLSKMMYWL